MTTALIADDEPLLRDELRDALRECWPELEIVDEVADGLAALEGIRQHKPDVAFLDIRMPRLSGLEVAEQVMRDMHGTHVVFVTAFDDHAIDAFERGAVDYVMKPIRVARLARTCERLRARAAAPSTAAASLQVSELLRQLMNSNGKPSYLKFVQASAGKHVRFVMVDEILYMQSDTKYTRIVTASGDAWVRKTLVEFESGLDPDMFWRVHRNTIVNIRAIDLVVREEFERLHLTIKGRAEKIDVSRPHQSQFRGM